MASRPVVDLYIPGLFNLPREDLSRLDLATKTPNINRLLRYASYSADDARDLDSTLCRLLGLRQHSLPYARAVSSDEKSTGILFKPVHLQSDINNAIIFPVKFNYNINNIISDLGNYFKVDCDIIELPDQTWLMNLKSIKPVYSMPHYLSALGRKITPFLVQAREHIEWYKYLNEIQMFLHQHPLNQQRQLKGLPIINSLWFWGADPYQGEDLSHLSWFSNDALLTHLGDLYLAQVSSISAFDSAKLNSHSIIIDLSILKALKDESEEPLGETLIALEREYFKPLMNRGDVQINLYIMGKQSLQFRSSMRFKWWRKHKRITDFLD